jgi:hypothetical protein
MAMHTFHVPGGACIAVIVSVSRILGQFPRAATLIHFFLCLLQEGA